MDLADFVAARLAEDNLLALASCTGSNDREWTAEPEGMFEGRILDSRGETVVYDEGSPTHAQALHIARHDPGRVLREVAAGRRLIYAYDAAQAMLSKYETGEKGTALTAPELQERLGWYRGTLNALTEAIRLRVSIYSDHPDYRPEWKVG